MSKSQVPELLKVWEHLTKDVLHTYPTLEMDLRKDLDRLKRVVEQRGITILLVTLPAIGKHFDRCLAIGKYSPCGLPLTKRVPHGEMAPVFLRRLFLLVFDNAGCLRDSPEIDAIFFIRQLCYVFKKAEFDCGPEKTSALVREFAHTDANLPEPEKFWTASSHSELAEHHCYGGFHKSELIKARNRELHEQSVAHEVSGILKVLDTVSNIFASTLGAYNPFEWRFRHGPGAISETSGKTNKYSWRSWPDALEKDYPIADCGFHSHSAWASHTEGNEMPTVVSPSRLCAVPKTFAGPRLIAAEPACHQWCQQNVRHYFDARVSDSLLGRFVSFRDQSTNQGLCSRGSRDGSLATLDLSEASDRMTCHVVGQFFRGNPKLLSSLRASRTRSVTQNFTDSVSGTIELRKFSTMGSACTFPVQTIVFLGLAIASVLHERKLSPTVKNILSLQGEVAVYGDDIIIPVDSREALCRTLEVLYFKVNTGKSFWTGKFRESCGVDSFDGNTVTPIYWKRPYSAAVPESLASVVECSNNFYKKFMLHTAAYLASTVPNDIVRVSNDSGVFGLKTRHRPRVSQYKLRYNSDLQRVEALVRMTKSSQVRLPTNDDTALFQYFTENPSPFNEWTHGIAQRPRTKVRRDWVPLSALL